MKDEAQRIADIYIKKTKTAFDLAIILSERVEYYSDRWGTDGIRFKVVKLLTDECEKRWKAERPTVCNLL